MKIVEELCSPPVGTSMTVVVFAPKREDLADSNARAAHDFAKTYALGRGFAARGMSHTPLVFPVNDAGETTEKVALGQERVAGYHAEFKFSTGI